MWARRVDSIQAEIVAALRRAGCLVWEVNGTFDLVVQRGERKEILECKSRRGSLTKSQEAMMASGWRVAVVWSPEDALRAMGLMPSPSGSPRFPPASDQSSRRRKRASG